MEVLEQILDQFDPISLEEMDSVRLMNRTDTKYIMKKSEFLDLLPLLQESYSSLEIKDSRIARYETTYYDKPNFEFYLVHQRGKKNRYKVRKRKYVDSDITFLEVKHKNNKGRTIKHRKTIPELSDDLIPSDKAYIKDISGLSGILESKLTNKFQRITLVNKSLPERLTFDLNLTFEVKGQHKAIEQLVIAELKQEQLNRASKFAQLVKSKFIRPERISKYCVGVALLLDKIKKNNIKEKLRTIDKLSNT